MNSKSQMSNRVSGNAVVVVEAQWESGGSVHLEMRKWNDGLYTVSELVAQSLSSRNTLGDTTHNTNKIGLSWDGGSV